MGWTEDDAIRWRAYCLWAESDKTQPAEHYWLQAKRHFESE